MNPDPTTPPDVQNLIAQYKASNPTQAASSGSWYDQVKSASAPAPHTSTSSSGWNPLGDVSTDIQNAGSDVNAAISGTGEYAGQNPIERGIHAAASAAGAIPNVVADVIPGGKPVLNAVGGAFKAATDAAGNAIGGTQWAQDFVQNHPDAANALQEAAQGGVDLGNIANVIVSAL